MQAIDKAIADSINKENADKTAGQDKQTSESNSQSVRSDSNSQSEINIQGCQCEGEAFWVGFYYNNTSKWGMEVAKTGENTPIGPK